MTPILRRILGGVAVVGALASVVAGRERPTLDLVQPRAAAPASVADLELGKLAARAEGLQNPEKALAPPVDPFAPRSFSPAVAAQPGKPAKPAAPPLPFRYLGKMIEDGKLNVFLARGEESLAVRAGSRIGEYRVDKVTDSEIVFTYLPLKTKQSLPL